MKNDQRLEEALNRLELAESSEGLRDRILGQAEAEWALDDGGQLRSQVLAAAEEEWTRPAPVTSTKWTAPLTWIGAAAAAAIAVVFTAGVANERALAKWQDPQPSISANSAVAESANRTDAALPALAMVGRSGSPKDLLQHLKRSKALLNNPKGDLI